MARIRAPSAARRLLLQNKAPGAGDRTTPAARPRSGWPAGSTAVSRGSRAPTVGTRSPKSSSRPWPGGIEMPAPLGPLPSQALSAFLALAFLAGSGWVLSAPTHPTAEAENHGSHNRSPEHRHPRHQTTDCCASCAIHCAWNLGLAGLHFPEAPKPGAAARSVPQRLNWVPLPKLRHLLPPSQGPPAPLG